jgi:hypothetical protein
MPNKTLYIKDSDLSIWERAEKLSSNGISPLVTILLRTYVDQHPVLDAEGMTTITVECRHLLTASGFEDIANPVKKSFVGRWLIPLEEKLTEKFATTETVYTPSFFAVAQTKKGAIAVYEGDDTTGDGLAELNVYRTFEEFAQAQWLNKLDDPNSGTRPRYPENVIAAVAAALQRDYVVHLDI